jgi:hypothetical protein
MNSFFIGLIALLLFRTIYYVSIRIDNWEYDPQNPISTDKLVPIYVEEVVMNLVIFYSIIIKSFSDNQMEENE